MASKSFIVVSSGVVLEVLMNSCKTVNICVVEAVDGMVTSLSGETLEVSVTGCVVMGLVVDV